MKKIVITNLAISIVIGTVFSIIAIKGSYAATNYAISSSNVEYKDNSDLGVTTVQAAIDGTCTKMDERLSNLESTSLDKIYPVGSIYISTTLEKADDVADALGGTWESYGKGMTLVGDDGTNYKTGDADKGTGGSTSVSTTLSLDHMPSHNHTINHTHTTGSSTLQSGKTTGNGISNASGWLYFGGSNGGVAGTQDIIFGHTGAYYTTYESGSSYVPGMGLNHYHNVTGTIPSLSTNSISTTTSGYKGSGKAFETSTIQPYIVVYMYRRTS